MQAVRGTKFRRVVSCLCS